MDKPKMDSLYSEYMQARFLDINKEQFIYIAHLLPSCLLAMSDGLLNKEEWMTLKRLSKILGSEFATEDLGEDEKAENLMLIYKAEIRYLLRHKEQWADKFIEALKEYFEEQQSSKDFVKETMDLFVSSEEESDKSKLAVYEKLTSDLGL